MNGCQEVALILQGIHTPQQLELPAVGAALNAGVMPCGHHVRSQALAVFQQGPKLDVPIARQVRVWCDACFTLQGTAHCQGTLCIRVTSQIMSLATLFHLQEKPQAASLRRSETCACQED